MITIIILVTVILVFDFIRRRDFHLDKTREGEALLWFTDLRGERKFKKL